MKRLVVLVLLVAVAQRRLCWSKLPMRRGRWSAGGALLGAVAGNAAIGAAIRGPVGLVGGYLLGDKFFKDDPGRKEK